MADTVNALVNSDNENGTQSAEWTPVEQIDPDQKVLLGRLNPLSGTMEATWAPSSGAAVFKEKTINENGIYDPQQEGADGYSMVTVDIPVSDDMVKLEPIQPSEAGIAKIDSSSLYMYNDDMNRTAIVGYIDMTNTGSTAYTISFSYPETFTPTASGRPNVHVGMISSEYQNTASVYNADSITSTVDTSVHTITLSYSSAGFRSEYSYTVFIWVANT